ncbi:MAG: helix-turn-helix domain-containing protein [Hadesarchaea archaeon]|nr:helix-turn-helix domain-containing protein [Hadesarchaea archaeon]
MFEGSPKSQVARWIAGDISISDDPGKALKRWREKFGINQTSLAEFLDISPSVISDYESGRRKSPGVVTVRKIVKALIDIDEEKGGQVVKAFSHRFGTRLPPDIVLNIQEFEKPISGEEFCEKIDGEIVANEELLTNNLFGYTVVDGRRAIVELTPNDFMRLYGLSTERALIFTEVSTGRSPLVAIKVRGITPGVVVLHGVIEEPDELGIRIAEDLRVPLVISRASSSRELLDKLGDFST